MPAFILLATQVIPLLIQAGMQIEPVISRLVHMKGDPTPDDWDFLHAQSDAANRIIFDTTRDVKG